MITQLTETFGVDISARWFDVAHQDEVRRFPNNPTGIAACLEWLAQPAGPVRIGMEATGAYHLPLATALHAAGHTVLVCDPLSIARYSQAVLARTKTDATDARRIARFCEAYDLPAWTPAPAVYQRLRALLTARETLVQERLRLRNRQHAASYTAHQALVTELQAPVLAAIETQIAHIDREVACLATAETPLGAQLRVLVTIPGLGLTTAGALLASLPLDRLKTSRQVAAYVGLCPQERSSGSSLRGRGHIGPLGPASLRKSLYMPAIVAMRCNPVLRVFAERLRAQGKRPKVVITAIMRKLLLLAWTLLRPGQPFSSNHVHDMHLAGA
jgi:transposase